MQVLNALQLKAGAKVKANRMGSITQPIQFLERKDKDEEWSSHNLDWLEWNGLKQIRRNARRLMKNYKLAKGVNTNRGNPTVHRRINPGKIRRKL